MTTPSLLRSAILPFLVLTVLVGQESRAGSAESKPAGGSFDRFETPEVVGLWPVPGSGGVAVVTSAGTVHFHDSKSGHPRRSIATGVVGWKRAVEGALGGRSIPALLRGIPVAVQDESVLAVDGSKLLELDAHGARRVICDDESLTGATVVRGTGIGGPVLIGTRKGLLCSVVAGRLSKAPTPLEEAVLLIAVAPNRAWCLSTGVGPYWHVRDIATLALTANAGNHLGEEFIHAIEVSRDSKHIAVTHGYTTCRIKAFSMTDPGLVSDFDAAKKGGAVCTTVAYDPTMRLLAAGDESGAVRVLPSGVGDAADLPRSQRLADDDGGGPIASSMRDLRTGKSLLVSDLGSWRVDRDAIRGVCFADDGRLVISVSQGGSIVARSWPGGEVVWTKKVPM